MTKATQNLDQNNKNSNKKVFTLLVGLVIIMFGFGYALVPLYNVLCNAWGINGKTGGQTELGLQIDSSRWVTVEFLTTMNANLPMKFYPMEQKVKVHPGENRLVIFFAENDSGKQLTVQAIPSLSPGLAAKYMKKTECFCFTQQTFAKDQAMDMPMIFHIDPSLPKDIHTITLSYTMFDTAGLNSSSSKVPGKIN